jgi:glutamyl-tRNA synthetase
VVRFRVPTDRQIVVDDLIRGAVAFDSNLLGGDLVLQRSDGSPLYHFTVAVDDAAMQISHVIRGEDHLSNTPKHLLLFEALGYPLPQFAHLPLILNADRSKMSKRKSQTAVADYRAQGFIPEALINYLVLLGWSTGSEEEMLSLPEMGDRFTLETVNSAGAVFDLNRLLKFNGQWIRKLPPDELVERLFPFLMQGREAGKIDWLPSGAELLALAPILQERLPTLAAVTETVGFLFSEAVEIPLAALTSKNWDQAASRMGLTAAHQTILELGSAHFEVASLEAAFHQLTASEGWKVGDLFMVIRVALTGRTATPPLFETMVALGYERTLSRLAHALARLS